MVLYIKNGRKYFDDHLLSCIEMKSSIEVWSILKNVDVRNLVDGYGQTLVHYAAIAGNDNTMKYLVRRGCQVNTLDSFGYTPLMYAMENNHSRVLSTLLESNADILLCGENQRSPLKTALYEQFEEGGSSINTVLFEALKKMCSEDRQHMARVLLDIECSLVEAMLLKDPVITECMLDAGRNVHEFDPDEDCTPLHHAVMNNDVDHVKLLLERGADIYVEDRNGEATPLWFYRPGGRDSYEMLITLLNHLSSLEAIDEDLVQCVFREGQINEIEAVIAQVAMIEASGHNIKERILKIIHGNVRYNKFLNLCREKLEDLQNTMINESVSLFHFFIDSEEKLLMYVRNPEVVAKLKKIVRRERRSRIFFVKRLCKGVENILKIAKLREEAALNLSRVTGIGQEDVIEKIILLLDKPSLQALGGI